MNSGVSAEEVLVTRSSRQEGCEPSSNAGCNWKAWIGRASRNSCASINGCRRGCGPKYQLGTQTCGILTLHEIHETIMKMYRCLRSSISGQRNSYLIPLFLS